MSMSTVEEQMRYFSSGFPFLDIDRPATTGDGIVSLDKHRTASLVEAYDSKREALSIVKFVPASGAATRMFKDMYEFLNTNEPNKYSEEVIANVDKFAFGQALRSAAGKDASAKELISALVEDGLNYGKLPKAMILFHKYKDSNRTAMEEHLAEGAMYAVGAGGEVKIHFTVSPEHRSGFERIISGVLERYEKVFGVKYSISYSQQSPSTDTIAVTPGNEPFRNADGSILFRPAGHGALIYNLDNIDADVIFVKNIDNVAPDHLKDDTVKYKKALCGLLLELQGKIFAYMSQLDKCDAEGADLKKIASFVENELCYRLPRDFNDMVEETKADLLREVLNRPIRVCGVVRNEGEPGGGPFWVNGDDGSQSLQIAESAEIAPGRSSLMSEATHFNPVDLVCGVRDYRGNKFDLKRFVNHNAGLISEKSKDGKPLKAQELPGLWNGSMSMWNTIFAEVPITTFSPVKVVNDLLRPQHQ